MKGERGEVILGLAILAGTLIPAMLLAAVVDVGDSLAARVILYGGAITAATVIWRQLVRPVVRACNVIFGLDDRVARIEDHLQIGHHAPTPDR